MMRQQKFLTEFLENIKSDPDKVLSTIEELRQVITQPSNIVLYLAANLHHLRDNPTEALSSFLPSHHSHSRKR